MRKFHLPALLRLRQAAFGRDLRGRHLARPLQALAAADRTAVEAAQRL